MYNNENINVDKHFIFTFILLIINSEDCLEKTTNTMSSDVIIHTGKIPLCCTTKVKQLNSKYPAPLPL